eukprot:g3501.t1
MASHGGAVWVHKEAVSHELLDESCAFLESLRLAATTGTRRLMGKTLLDPKKDSKWERGRTRQVLHFGAHVRGGKAVGAEVEELPKCLVEVARLLQARGFLQPASSQESAGETTPEKRVVAATVDFFRKGSYTPTLSATAPLLDAGSSPGKPADTAVAAAAAAAVAPPPTSAGGQPENAQGISSNTRSAQGGDTAGGKAALGLRGESDTEAVVCMLWLQGEGGDVVVGSAPQLANCGRGEPSNEAPRGSANGAQSVPSDPDITATAKAAADREKNGPCGVADTGDGEGMFLRLERVSAPRGSVIVWDGAQAQGGLQVAVPRTPRHGILVSFQTLTPAASSRVLENRRVRDEARERAAALRRAVREAKEAKAKGPIPGTPVVVADWTEQELARENGALFKTSPSACSAGTAKVSKKGSNRCISSGSDDVGGSSGGRQGGEDDGKTPSIEKEHVQAVYDTIAPHWSHTRYKPWPKVEKFLKELPPCSLVADAGCGNGKYLGCDAAGGYLLGTDASVNLLTVCKERLPTAEVFAGDCMRLPFRSQVFDAAISIAVLHHFSSEARRLRALSELRRLVRPGGRVLVYAWAIEQEQDSRRSFAAQDVLVPWHLADQHNRKPDRLKDTTTTTTNNTPAEDCGGGGNAVANDFEADETKAHCAAAEGSGSSSSTTSTTTTTTTSGALESTESTEGGGASAGGAESTSSAPTPAAPRHGVRVDATDGSGAGSVVYQRYCHVYAEGELEGLVERVEGLKLVESYYDRSNWCVVAEREG